MSARARGGPAARNPSSAPARLKLARSIYDELGADGKRRYTVQEIADEFGVTRPTVYRTLGGDRQKAEPTVRARGAGEP